MRREEWEGKNNVRRIRREEQEVKNNKGWMRSIWKEEKEIMSKKYIKIPSTAHSKSLWCLDVLKMLKVPQVFWFPCGQPQGNNTLGYPRDLRLYPGVP